MVGGLYGNVEALEALAAMAAREERPVTIVFNGDFHWFDAAEPDFEAIAQGVARHVRMRGNVETEISGEDTGAGCGCAYPLDVSDAEVSRSNAILERLRATSRRFPEDRESLARLPMHLVARVAEARIGIVHGDAASLAGWGFSRDCLDDPARRRWIESAFRDARVDVFASTHTCLPALRRFDFAEGARVVANNGAAGMPNFSSTTFGLVTRIARARHRRRLFGVEIGGAQVEAVPIEFDTARWVQRFLAAWPEGSPAHASYYRRITTGPRFALAQAAPRGITP